MVTFVLTDIEGSTSLFRRLGDDYVGLLAIHDDLVRGAMRAHGGVEFGNEGDSLLLAFSDAAEAMAACLDAQVALTEHDWPEGAELRVRMGVHTGEAQPVGGKYVSIAIHQVARICSAAHGGQVLVSEATASLVADRLADGAELTILGTYQLRGFTRPEPIYQFSHRSLQSAFSPVRAMGVVAHNLPLQRTSFIGRDRELEALASLLGTTGVVSIVGPAGVGKTRLAIQVALGELDRFPDGTWLADLAKIHDPEAVPKEILSVLGLGEDLARPLVEQLVGAMRPKRLLLILDNCEHLLEPVAVLVGEITRQCPDVTVMVTSREPLDVDGEVVWRLETLATEVEAEGVSDAARLFVERAQLVQPNFELAGATAPDVTQIVTHLNGIPLAIELAAAALGEFSVAGVLAGLNDRFALLTRGRRNAPDRHQTLRGAIEWSLDLLGPDERCLFRRLAVFAGDWSTGSASKVCGFEPVLASLVPGFLAHLARASLIIANPDAGRWSMLESVRELAAMELAESGEFDDVVHRHRLHFLETATELGPLVGRRGRANVVEEIETEQANLRRAVGYAFDAGDAATALRMCAALAPYWTSHGDWRTGVDLSTRALECPGGDPSDRAEVQAAMGRFLLLSGEIARAGAQFEEALAEAAEDDHIVKARALLGLGLVDFRVSMLEEAEGRWTHALEEADRAGDAKVRAEVLRGMAIAAGTRGDQAEAAELIRQGIEAAQAAEDDQLLRLLLASSAEAKIWLGDYSGSEAAYGEALSLANEIGDLSARPLLLAELGWVALLRGDPVTARRLGQEASELAEDLDNPRVIAHSLRLTGEAFLLLGDPEVARGLLDEALEVAISLRAPAEIAGVLTSTSYNALQTMRFDEAASLAERAGEQGSLIHSMRLVTPEWLEGVATVFAGDLDHAEETFEKMLHEAEIKDIRRYISVACWGLGKVSQGRGERPLSADRYRRSAETSYALGDPLGVATALVGLALATASSDPEGSVRTLETAGRLRIGAGAVPTSLQELEIAEVVKKLSGHQIELSGQGTTVDMDEAMADAFALVGKIGHE